MRAIFLPFTCPRSLDLVKVIRRNRAASLPRLLSDRRWLSLTSELKEKFWTRSSKRRICEEMKLFRSWGSTDTKKHRCDASHVVLVILLFVPLMNAELAMAGQPAEGEARSRFCSRPFTQETLFRSEASQDLYNAALWMSGSAAIQFGAKKRTHWTRSNSFDDELRSGLRSDSRSTREAAGTASDILLGLSAALIPLASIGKTLSERDCYEAYDMATDAAEAFTLTLMLTSGAKRIAGRQRPYEEDCSGSPPPDANCGDPDRKQSFFSGHASMAATGAGLSCSYAMKRKTWGESRAARFTPCALGLGAAVTTGALRIVADRHWGSDVIVGLVVGATVGYFDTWGPFDLLRFEAESEELNWDISGMILPYADGREVGIRVGLTF
jgi:membrane-associated phospholipid phosphatase